MHFRRSRNGSLAGGGWLFDTSILTRRAWFLHLRLSDDNVKTRNTQGLLLKWLACWRVLYP